MALVLFESGRKLLRQRGDVLEEDFVQTLFGKYAIVTFCVLSIITTPGQYFTEPITCWNSLKSHQASFFDRKCLIKGTYPLPDEYHVESYAAPNRMLWYPFTPLIVILQAVPFVLITAIWTACNRSIGIEISKVTEAAKGIETINGLVYVHRGGNAIESIVLNLNALLKSNSSPENISFHNQNALGRARNKLAQLFSSGNMSSLSNALVTVKLFNILAIVINISILSYLIGEEYLYIGIKFFYRMSLSRPVLFHEMFPIVVMCQQNTQIGINGNKLFKYPCVLNLNVFNEKVFIFIWFWYFLHFIIGIIDLMQTCCFQCSSRIKRDYFCSYLPPVRTQAQIAAQRRFFSDYGSNDCFTLLKIMANHLDNWTMTALCSKFYEEYLKQVTRMKMHEDVNIHDSSSSSNHDLNNNLDNFENLTRRSFDPAMLQRELAQQ